MVLSKTFGPKTEEVQGNGESYIIRSFLICTLTPYCSGDKIENNENGGTCKYGGEERCIEFWWRKLRERDQLEDSGVDGRIILITGSIKLKIGTDDRHL
jgi:hypothetical protein